MNGDKYGDVVVRQWDAIEPDDPGSVYALQSNGSQFHSPKRDLAQIGDPILGDVDGDGRDDVVFFEKDDEEMLVSVEPAQGEGWTAKLQLDPAFEIYPGWSRLADLNGDGFDDVVLAGNPQDGVDGIHVALNEDGKGFGTLTQWYKSNWGGDAGTNYVPILAGDFDGDGTDEVLHFGEGTGKIKVGHLEVLKAGDDKFELASERDMTDIFVTPVFASWIVGDVDDDGADELVVLEIIRLGPGDYVTDGARVFAYNFEDLAMQSRGKRWRNLTDDEATADPEAPNARTQRGEELNAVLSDVDGDGADDIVVLRETEGADSDAKQLLVYVLRAGENSFGEPELWSEVPCPDDCADAFRLIE